MPRGDRPTTLPLAWADIDRLEVELVKARQEKDAANGLAEYAMKQRSEAVAEVESLRTQLEQLRQENRSFRSLFSDYEEPCESFEQANAIWHAMRNREGLLRVQLAEARQEIERLKPTCSRGGIIGENL